MEDMTLYFIYRFLGGFLLIYGGYSIGRNTFFMVAGLLVGAFLSMRAYNTYAKILKAKYDPAGDYE